MNPQGALEEFRFPLSCACFGRSITRIRPKFERRSSLQTFDRLGHRFMSLTLGQHLGARARAGVCVCVDPLLVVSKGRPKGNSNLVVPPSKKTPIEWGCFHSVWWVGRERRDHECSQWFESICLGSKKFSSASGRWIRSRLVLVLH